MCQCFFPVQAVSVLFFLQSGSQNMFFKETLQNLIIVDFFALSNQIGLVYNFKPEWRPATVEQLPLGGRI